MKHVIIGTAGHVDHGKTVLVKALTGTEEETGLSRPPESRLTARPPMPMGRPPAPGTEGVWI